MRKGLVASAIVSAVFAAVFAVAGSLRSDASAQSIAWLTIAGALLGAIAAPELLDPGTFRYPALWQMFFSVLGCLLIAFGWGVPREGYVLAIVGGAVVGYIAPVWIKHLQLP